MKIQVRELRRLIREALKDDFDAEASRIVYTKMSNDSTKDYVLRQRAAKKLWNKYADHSFFDSLIKVHWTKRVKDLFSANSRDELSVTLYDHNQLPILRNEFGEGVGLLLKGRITYASNNMDNIVTGVYKKRQVNPSSKVVRRPSVPLSTSSSKYDDDEDNFDRDAILDKETFKNSPRNEGIIANWNIKAIIVDPKDAAISDVLQLLEENPTLKVLDLNLKEISLEDLKDIKPSGEKKGLIPMDTLKKIMAILPPR